MEKVYDLKIRTKLFAIEIVKLCEVLFSSKNETQKILGRQLLRSGTSIGANYRAAQRAKSSADFLNKLKIVEEEADETVYWLELLNELISDKEVINKLKIECNEIIAIIVSSIIKTRNNIKK